MIRSSLLLLAALLAGALFAQESDADLRMRVEHMRRELTSLARLDRRMQPIVRAYDLKSLRDTARSQSVTPRDLRRGNVNPTQFDIAEPARDAWDSDAVAQLVIDALGPDAEVTVKPGAMVVRATPEEHTRVHRIIRQVRKLPRARYVVEIRVVPARPEDAARIAPHRRRLPPALADEFAARSALGSAQMVCVDAVQTPFFTAREHGYVWDYETEVAGEATIGQARAASVYEGLMGDVLLASDAGANGVLLHLRLQWQQLANSPRSVDTEHGPLTLPTLDVVRMQTSFWAPVGHAVLAGSCTRGLTPCHIVVRVRLRDGRR